LMRAQKELSATRSLKSFLYFQAGGTVCSGMSNDA